MKKGSALLIVLGMLSFMVLSGLAFSIYMRQARLPSSFLRRSVMTRELAKAALAEAIEAIDETIGNNPYPGVGGVSTSVKGGATSYTYRNRWTHRVMLGNTNFLCSATETVPTLTLEGLAYVPPWLINEVRYYSRRTPTAKWQALWFDSGRYAFTAIDVSDHFDVNRMLMNHARTSGASRRISFAHLFENGYDHDTAGNGAQAWETFMGSYRSVDNMGRVTFPDCPFVSLADFNLAFGAQGEIGGLRSPFCDYMLNGKFYETGGSAEDPLAEKYRGMTFVTDGWFPKPTYNSQDDEEVDLSVEANQPFTMAMLQREKQDFMTVASFIQGKRDSGEFYKRAKRYNFLSYLTCFALYDYLDDDNIPLSLAIPTTERVPMICGLEPHVDGSDFKIEKVQGVLTGPNGEALVEETTFPDGATRTVERKDTYRLKANFGTCAIKTLVTYPFLHTEESANNDAMSGCQMDGRVAFFFTKAGEDVKLTLPGSNVSDANVLQYGHRDFKDLNTANQVKVRNGVVAAPFKCGNPSFSAIHTEDDAISDAYVGRVTTLAQAPSALATDDNALLQVTWQWTQTYVIPEGSTIGTWTPVTLTDATDKKVVKAHCGLTPLKADRTVDPDFSDDAALKTRLGDDGTGNLGNIKLHMALWARVTSAGDTLDLVPACMKEDDDVNQIQNYQRGRNFNSLILGYTVPLLKFDAGLEIPFSITDLDTLATAAESKQITLTPQTILVADPRFNHDPESWFQTSDSLTKTAWKDLAKAENGDIFLSTSDQWYLQSFYELAFLPRFTEPSDSPRNVDVDMLGENYESRKNLSTYETHGRERNYGMMWRSYRPFDQGTGRPADYFDGPALVAGTTGMRVNPYSDSTNVIMAAFANTPHEWSVASTNNQANPFFNSSGNATTFNGAHAWNSYSTGDKLFWEDLREIAGDFIHDVRSCTTAPNPDTWWQEKFADLGWWEGSGGSGAESTPEQFLCGLKLQSGSGKIYNVDRKFLYGFWHDSFAARQQLFLIFVRAEPIMMGGGVKNAAPPQLGTRAVALVWRDPMPTKENGDPHRTRVLFYHPFD